MSSHSNTTKESQGAMPADRQPAASEGTSGNADAPRKPYKKPGITRHGNLRMMTQLE